MRNKMMCVFLLCLASAGPGFPGQEPLSMQIEINAPKIAVFDAASQVIMQQGYSFLSTNERIGMINTDYKDAKESGGSSVLRSLMGREDYEIMITTSITEVNGTSTLRILPKGRQKKVNKLNIATFEEFELNKKAVEKFRPLAEQIKALAEQSANITAPTPAPPIKTEEAKPAPAAQQTVAVEPPKSVLRTVETAYVRIKVPTANIRQTPSLQGPIVKKSSQGDEFKVIGVEGVWSEVLLSETSVGYIHKDVCTPFMKSEKVESPAPPAAKAPIPISVEPGVQAPKLAPNVNKAAAKDDSQNESPSEKNFLFGLGVEGSFPMGDWSDVYSIGFGLDVNALFRIVDNLYLGGYFGSSIFLSEHNLTLLRLQPMAQVQYRYPLSQKLHVFGGLGLGLAIDTVWYSGYYDSSETKVAFATDLFIGIKYGGLYFAPRIRLVSHEGASFGSFDLPFGFFF